ncbi:MAG TPA: membrane protein insertion efficiency factor YidD [Thermoanaerobaculia bacterium]
MSAAVTTPGAALPPAPGAGARAAAAVFGAYKKLLSPLLPPACRFTPTCSEYARDAVLRHGLSRGLALAARRLARCHPFHAGGHDPVP